MIVYLQKPAFSSWRRFAFVGVCALLMFGSSTVSASDDATEDNSGTIGLATLAPSFPVMDVIADEVIRRIDAAGIPVEPVMREATLEEVRQSSEAGLFLAGLDAFITPKDDDDAGSSMSAASLLGSLVPVAEVVRDHQAFLMLQTRNAQELRSRFARAHGAAGPMSIGGLTPKGERDHLVAMMLMDSVGQDAERYPYRQYDSLESMALGLLTGEVKLLSMPVSRALQMSLEGGIKIIATTANERQDVIRNVPTLVSARIDLTFTNYIGLYRPASEQPDERLQPVPSLIDQSSDEPWPSRVYELGLVDDYTNKGSFAVNVLRELSRMKRFAQMVE